MPNHHTREIPELTEEEREELQRWRRRQKTAQALALRARIVLASAGGKSDQAVANTLGTTFKWRRRFLRKRCDGLLDEPRPGAPRKISDKDVERVVVRTLESCRRGQRSEHAVDGQGVGLSFSTVGRKAAPQRDIQAVQRPVVH